MPHVSLAVSTDFTAGGTPFFSDAVTTAVQVKATRGQIYLLDLMNGTAATAYLQVFFQPAAAVTLGTTTPDMVIKLPTNAGSGFTKTIAFPVPVGGFIPFGTTVFGSLGVGKQGVATGLTIAGTTTPGGSTTAAIGVTAIYS